MNVTYDGLVFEFYTVNKADGGYIAQLRWHGWLAYESRNGRWVRFPLIAK